MKQEVSKVEVFEGIEYKYSSDWIRHLEGEEHWRFYWHQLNLILPELKKGDRLLEIGPGSGFLSNYLRSKGFQVITLDIDEEKSPDINANLVEYGFPDIYDHILAFEVFEHIPFEKFQDCLHKIRKATRKNLFFSVPLNQRIFFGAELIIPYFKYLSFFIRLKRRSINANHHFWELNYKEYTWNRLMQALASAGFTRKHSRRIKTVQFFHFEKSLPID